LLYLIDKTKSNNRTVSIDRSSSDKENNLSSPTMNTSGNKTKTSTKKNKTGSRQSTNSRSQTGKKAINKKKKTIIKSIKTYPMDTNDAPPSLSIEERVKLRRTKPFLTPIKPVLNKKVHHHHPIKKVVKRIHSPKANKKIIKSKKFFLGSGLDLDNIVLGNRQRRSLQT
jgi:chlorite dismutase